jgi:hypothetical protein
VHLKKRSRLTGPAQQRGADQHQQSVGTSPHGFTHTVGQLRDGHRLVDCDVARIRGRDPRATRHGPGRERPPQRAAAPLYCGDRTPGRLTGQYVRRGYLWLYLQSTPTESTAVLSGARIGDRGGCRNLRPRTRSRGSRPADRAAVGTAEVVDTAAAAVPTEPAVGQQRHRTSIRPARELQARPGREIFRRIRCTGRSPPRTVAPPTSVSCISDRALLLRRLRKALNSMTVSSSAPFCIGCHQHRQSMRAYAFAPRPTESTFPSGPADNRARGHSCGHLQVTM